MCLITDQKEPKIAETDLTTYKILTKNLVSPFQHFQYEFGKEYEQEISKADFDGAFDGADQDYYEKLYDSESFDKNVVFFGKGLHSSLNIGRLYPWTLQAEHDIYECKVPKGAEYYEGHHGLIVSNKLTVVEKIVPAVKDYFISENRYASEDYLNKFVRKIP